MSIFGTIFAAKKDMLKKVFTLLFSFLFIFNVFAGDIYESIAIAIKSGNAKEVTRFLDKTIEITIGDKESAYSKVQAEAILKDFFSKNTPRDFKLVHKGASEGGAKYGIGNYITSNKTYRTYFYIKKVGAQYLIQELRFEQE